MIYAPWGLLLILIIIGVGVALFRDKIDPTVLKLVYFVLFVLVLIWLFSLIFGWWPSRGEVVVPAPRR